MPLCVAFLKVVVLVIVLGKAKWFRACVRPVFYIVCLGSQPNPNIPSNPTAFRYDKGKAMEKFSLYILNVILFGNLKWIRNFFILIKIILLRNTHNN